MMYVVDIVFDGEIRHGRSKQGTLNDGFRPMQSPSVNEKEKEDR